MNIHTRFLINFIGNHDDLKFNTTLDNQENFLLNVSAYI